MWEIDKSKNKVWPKITYDGVEVEYMAVTDDQYEVDCSSWEEFINFILESHPKSLEFSINFNKTKIKSICSGLLVRKRDNKYIFETSCIFPNKNWISKWNPNLLVRTIASQSIYTDLTIIDSDIDSAYGKNPYIAFSNETFEVTDIENQMISFIQQVDCFVLETENSLGKLLWKDDYNRNEKLFSSEVVFPLLRRMGFLSVRYTHGNKEFGKDFIFFELNNFNIVTYSAVQVKVGDISGGVKSIIDEIIGQLEDAFAIPISEVNQTDNLYISSFYVITSGLFTNNAREKIIYNVPKTLKGSVFFIDKYKLLELVEKYWSSNSVNV